MRVPHQTPAFAKFAAIMVTAARLPTRLGVSTFEQEARESRMSTNPPTRKKPRSVLDKDRRAAPGVTGKSAPLRRLKGVLVRPLGLERRDGQLHLVLAERRRVPSVDAKPSLSQLCDELSARLLAYGPDYAARAMRHLVLVHDALGRKGWPGVAALPGTVLVEALAQAEMLASEEQSPSLEMIIEGLRPLQSAADLRDQRESRLQDFKIGENLEVSESTHAEFDHLQRSWAGTTPSELMPPERDQ